MAQLNQRGMFLEKLLALTHQSYRTKHQAMVYKVPVLQMLNPNSNYKRAHYFCDYVGCYQGYYYEFEAKETVRPQFHWNQLRKSQQYKLHQVELHHGLGFIIIYFAGYQQFWLVFYNDLSNFIRSHSQIIDYANCQKIGVQVRLKANSVVDYLPILAKKIASLRDNLPLAIT